MNNFSDTNAAIEPPIRRWLEQVLYLDQFHCAPSSLSQSNEWHIVDGAIRHISNRFFSVIGLTWENEGVRQWQPFIDQREIGTLGFVLRHFEDDKQLLCYAKIEPGNIGTVQIAPTCQATKSNLERIHGGKEPPYAKVFTVKRGETLSRSLQSEQGTRFFKKRNLNTVVVCNDVNIEDEQHQWVSLQTFQRLLATDFVVNTDARSVICTSDWQQLFPRPLFSINDSYTIDLRASFEAPINTGLINEIDQRIHDLHASSPSVEVCPVDTMPGWNFKADDPTTLSNGYKSILHFTTHSETREVTDWNQPIFSTHHREKQTLLCGRKGTLLKFGFRLSWEPGLFNHVELAPSILGTHPPKLSRAIVRLSVNQSDEGGRFYHDVTNYSILDIGEIDSDSGMVWLTLSEIHNLLPRGYFNNEARSALSLILVYA